MSKKERNFRAVYIKDPELTKTDIGSYDEATRIAGELKEKYPEPLYRIRVRLRSRTDKWDVLTKRRTEIEVKDPEPAPAEAAS